MTHIQFKNHEGLTLTGDLEMPENNQPRAFALFAHCFSCTRKIRAAVHITRAMAAQGIAVLRFDFTGLGQSEGDFADSSFSANVDDLLAAADWIAKEHQPVQILVGHSLGGTAVLAAAPQIASCRAVACINAPAEPKHVLHHLHNDLDNIKQTGSAVVNLGGRPFRIRQDFVDDVRNQDISQRLHDLKRALLVLHAPLDQTVDVQNAQNIFAAALHPKSFVSLDKADHLLSNPSDSKYAGVLIAHWASRYLDPVESNNTEPVTTDEAVSDGVTVIGRTKDGFACRVQSGRHQWISDEPSSMGGLDTGPDPYAHLCAALASCTVMTLNMYAKHKKLAVEQVSVNVKHDRIHAKDCADCERTDGKIDRLHRQITILGKLTTEQRQRMLEIADRCPVHRTLENEIKVDSRLVE